MVRVLSVGSGSSGNCFYLEINGKKLMIDVGLPCRTIRAALHSVGTDLGDLDAVLISHTHSDHIRGLDVCRKYITCPVYTSELSRNRLFCFDPVPLPGDRPYELCEGITVSTFETSHDCPGSIGFRFDYDGESFGYATDLGCVTPHIREMLTGCKSIVLESNHDMEMLKNGPYPFVLKRRILSENGHLSNEDCAEAAAFFARNGTRCIFLAHLSKENNDPQVAKYTVERKLEGCDVCLSVLPDNCGSLICIE